MRGINQQGQCSRGGDDSRRPVGEKKRKNTLRKFPRTVKNSSLPSRINERDSYKVISSQNFTGLDKQTFWKELK